MSKGTGPSRPRTHRRGSHAVAPEITPDVLSSWPHRREDHSAGGVTFRRGVDVPSYEVALIATRGGTRWQLPKGACEADESSEQTAMREVEEEVGLLTTVEEFLTAIEYWYWDTFRRTVPELVHKRVDFFLLRTVGGVLSDKSFEIDSAGWFAPDQALGLLTFAGEREVMELAIERLMGDGVTGDSPVTPSPVTQTDPHAVR